MGGPPSTWPRVWTLPPWSGLSLACAGVTPPPAPRLPLPEAAPTTLPASPPASPPCVVRCRWRAGPGMRPSWLVSWAAGAGVPALRDSSLARLALCALRPLHAMAAAAAAEGVRTMLVRGAEAAGCSLGVHVGVAGAAAAAAAVAAAAAAWSCRWRAGVWIRWMAAAAAAEAWSCRWRARVWIRWMAAAMRLSMAVAARLGPRPWACPPAPACRWARGRMSHKGEGGRWLRLV